MEDVLVASLGRCRGDAGEIWGRYRGDTGEIQDRCRGDIGEMYSSAAWGGVRTRTSRARTVRARGAGRLAPRTPRTVGPGYHLVRVRVRVRVRDRVGLRVGARVRARED